MNSEPSIQVQLNSVTGKQIKKRSLKGTKVANARKAKPGLESNGSRPTSGEADIQRTNFGAINFDRVKNQNMTGFTHDSVESSVIGGSNSNFVGQ